MHDSDPKQVDVLVVGAGVAGLTCAGTLPDSMEVRVLEKSRGVGGRCATRRIREQPVDHGLAFYHGDDREFLSAIRAVEGKTILDWPRRIVGQGAACQPRAFHTEQQRLAFAEGVSAFPKQLARGLAIDRRTRASGIESDGDGLAVATESGPRYRARSIVLALPAGQTVELLRTLRPPGSRELEAAIALLAGVSTVRCLTLIAGYPSGAQLPGWDVCYPPESDILQMVSQDSTKRSEPVQPILVLQSRPRWSAERWDDPPERWTREMLASAKPFCGEWAANPSWTDTHRWRYARLAGGEALTAPLLLRLDNGCTVGIVGEAMAGGGGVQAAWQSGRRMARRLIEDR